MLKKVPKILLATVCCWTFALHAGPQPVARVSMAVGDAQRIGASGQVTPLSLGTQLSEQDRIITGKDAMVILIFSDQARVALRPDSELLIRRYKVDPNGAETELQLDLLRGTVRQISGRAAQKQPERYRLNTPIAAIGVRGTDFLAKSGEGLVEAYVHEGAIVVAPLGGAGTPGEIPAANLGAGFGVQYSRADRSKNLERQNVGQNDVERLFGMRIAASVSTDRTAAGNTAGNAAQPDKKDRTEQTVVASLAPARDRDATGVSMQSTASLAGGVVQSSVMMVPNTPDLPSPPLVVPPVTSPEVLPPSPRPSSCNCPRNWSGGSFPIPKSFRSPCLWPMLMSRTGGTPPWESWGNTPCGATASMARSTNPCVARPSLHWRQGRPSTSRRAKRSRSISPIPGCRWILTG